jgi:hypothetical protein
MDPIQLLLEPQSWILEDMQSLTDAFTVFLRGAPQLEFDRTLLSPLAYFVLASTKR